MLKDRSTQSGGGETNGVWSATETAETRPEPEPVQAERVLAEVAALHEQAPDGLYGEARTQAAYLLNEAAGLTFPEVSERLRIPADELGADLVAYRKEVGEDAAVRDRLGYLRIRLASAEPLLISAHAASPDARPAPDTPPSPEPAGGASSPEELPPLPPPASGEILTPEQLLEHAGRQFGLSRELTWSTSRRPEAVRGRYAGYLLLKEDYELTVPQIAVIVGKQEGTVNQAIRSARQAAIEDYALALDVQELRARLSGVEFSVKPERRPKTSTSGAPKAPEIPDDPTEEEIRNTDGFSEDELPDAVVLAAARRFRVRPDDILGSGRKGGLNVARDAAFLAMREAGLEPRQIADFTERKAATVSTQLSRTRKQAAESDELRQAINWILGEVKDIDPPAPAPRSRSFGSFEYETSGPPARPRPMRRFRREVPEEEQRLFDELQDGQEAARARFEELYGGIPERVVGGLFQSEPPAEAWTLAANALTKAARFFVPDQHPDFESWAEKVIAKDLEELVSREGKAQAAAAIRPEVFVETATEYRRRYRSSSVMRITGKHDRETTEARKKAQTFLAERLAASDDPEAIPARIRQELAKRFPEDVRWMARVPHGLRRLAEREDEVPQLPRFQDLSDHQQEEVMGLVLVKTVRSLVA